MNRVDSPGGGGHGGAPRLRVLRLRSSSQVYGPERGFLEQSIPLCECGVDTELALLYRRPASGPGEHPIVALARQRKLPVHQLPDTSQVSWGTARRVAALLRGGQFDLLQTHGYKADLIGLLASALARRRRVAVMHGLHTATSARLRLYDRLDLGALRRFDLLIAVSEHERERIVRRGIAAPRVVTVHNSIDVRAFAERSEHPASLAELGVRPGAAMVAIAGRLQEQKDHATFLTAAARTLQELPGARFLIIGDGPLRGRLEALAATLGIAASVHFLGYRDDCPALMGRCDLVVLSSVEEPFGYVLLEAMAAARPVVATRVGGASEVVEDGRTGRLVPAAAPEAMATAMLEILSNRELAAAWGKAGRQRAELLFDVRAAAPRLAGLYRAVAAGGRPPFV